MEIPDPPSFSMPVKLNPTERQIQVWAGGNIVRYQKLDADQDKESHPSKP
jgi:hypothetical protein